MPFELRFQLSKQIKLVKFFAVVVVSLFPLNENEKLTNQVQKSQLGKATINEKQEASLSFEDNSFENFRGKLSNFEKNVLGHF